jgi:hypothetical protein
VIAAPYSADERERWLWAEDVIAQAMEMDEQLAKSIGRGPLVPLAEGASSMVFSTPNQRVVRLTNDTNMDECAVIESLVGREVVGWPYVFDIAHLAAAGEEVADLLPDDWEPDASLCIAVVEEVTPASAMDRRTRRHKDIVEAAFAVRYSFPRDPERRRLSDQAYGWALQLRDGLLAIGRENKDYEIDLYNEGNWGLDKNDNAVWIDFGV